MTDHDTTESPAEYEPPAIVSLGTVAKMTQLDDEQSVVHTTTFESDQLLKEDMAPVHNALVRLRWVQTRYPAP